MQEEEKMNHNRDAVEWQQGDSEDKIRSILYRFHFTKVLFTNMRHRAEHMLSGSLSKAHTAEPTWAKCDVIIELLLYHISGLLLWQTCSWYIFTHQVGMKKYQCLSLVVHPGCPSGAYPTFTHIQALLSLHFMIDWKYVLLLSSKTSPYANQLTADFICLSACCAS